MQFKRKQEHKKQQYFFDYLSKTQKMIKLIKVLLNQPVRAIAAIDDMFVNYIQFY